MQNRVRDLRERAGGTQEGLARDLKVSRQTIISIENGKHIPSLPLAMDIARRFNRFVEEVFSADGNYPGLALALPQEDDSVHAGAGLPTPEKTEDI